MNPSQYSYYVTSSKQHSAINGRKKIITLWSIYCDHLNGRNMEHVSYHRTKSEAEKECAFLNSKEIAHANPTVGSKGTRICYTDREPVVVTRVSKSGKKVWVKDLKCEMVKGPKLEPGGFSAFVVEEAKWKILDETEGTEQVYTFRNNGRWVRNGDTAKNGEGISFRYCGKFYDHAF